MVDSFRAGKIQLIVCSDALARGMDIDDVDVVINYDAPHYTKTYVHRVGRTARAGRAGTAITLLQRREVRYFKKMISTADATVSNYSTKNHEEVINPYINVYQRCLYVLQKVLADETAGNIANNKPVPKDFMLRLKKEAESIEEQEGTVHVKDSGIEGDGDGEGDTDADDDSSSSSGSDSNSDSDTDQSVTATSATVTNYY